MRRGFAAVGATVVALLASGIVSTPRAQAATGMRVRDGRLVEADGNDLVLRGINHPYAWYPNQTGAFTDVKAAGANAIRLSLIIGQRFKPATTAAELSRAIALCKRSRLICIFEAQDTMGYGQQEGAATIDQAVDYWISVRSALVGQENYVIVNVADEPFGYHRDATWTRDTIRAIGRLRAAGFQHTLMVGGPDWGQDDSFTMRDNAAAVFAADPARNTVFDVHMYGMFNTPAKVRDYLQSFIKRRLPIVVGEFSANHPYGRPAVDAVLRYCQAYRIGFLGWSWSGNTEASYLDMVKNFNPGLLTPWGVRFLTGVNGLRANAHEATIFSGAARSVRTRKRWRWSDLLPWAAASVASTPVPTGRYPPWPLSASRHSRAPRLAAVFATGYAGRSAPTRPAGRWTAWTFPPG